MKKKRLNLMEQDDTLRLIFAFQFFISEHPNWIIESETAKKNREIAKSILSIEDTADDYFIFHNRFYSFTVSKEEEKTIDCRIEEYHSFYDLTDSHLAMNFSYHIPSNKIITSGEVETVQHQIEKAKQKVA